MAAFSHTRLVGAGNQVALDGSASSDPDGTIASWRWSTGRSTLATGRTATISLSGVSSADITLTVIDNQGATATVTKTLNVGNRAPDISGVSPSNGAVVGSNTPTLSATASDPDADALQYQFRLTGPSVDITSEWGGSQWTVPAHRLEDPGTGYRWTVTVRDSRGLTATRATDLRIAMLPTARQLIATSDGGGYWQVASDGGVFSYGSARFFGSLPGLNVRVTNIIGMARTPTDQGYWLVGSDGGVYAFGDAPFAGSLPGRDIRVNNIVGMAPTKDGKGYWLTGADGGVFAFGTAPFLGSMGGKSLNAPVEGMAPTATSQGYYLVAKDGGVFAFGDAPFLGSMGGKTLNAPVVDIAADPDGRGYWLVAEDGGVFAYEAPFHGSLAGKPLNGRITSLSPSANGGGYWLNACDGGVFAFNVPFLGSNPTYGCRGIPAQPSPSPTPAPTPAPTPPPAPAPADRLNPGQRLGPGAQLVSATSGYVLTMQTDGNLVLYAADRRVLFQSRTGGNAGTVLVMQTDGNLVLYAPGNRAIWASNTAGNANSVLLLQGDGNAVIYAPGNRPVWWTAGK